MRSSIWVAAAIAITATQTGCAGTPGCPKAGFPASEKAEWAAALDKKEVLLLDGTKKINIKRDVHNIIVNVDAKPFADAFMTVMTDPKRRFGLIEVDRKPENVGKPFTLGERFQGRYGLVGAIKDQLGQDFANLFGPELRDPAYANLVCQIENDNTSDYGVLSDLVMGPPDAKEFRFAYRYLNGSPIAGSSTFTVLQLAPGTSRVTQIFEYQEQSQTFAMFFTAAGLKLHNQVVWSQVRQAVELAGGAIVSSDIPEAYR
jgi:hypothetical protein